MQGKNIGNTEIIENYRKTQKQNISDIGTLVSLLMYFLFNTSGIVPLFKFRIILYMLHNQLSSGCAQPLKMLELALCLEKSLNTS
jgi:hypothetical protein